MQRGALLGLLLLAASTGEVAAQSEAAKAMAGTWEFSNADRDRICTLTFRTDRGPGGMRVEFDRNCVNLYPFVRDIVAWTLSENDFLRLLDAQGKSVLDFSEVESGIYEAPRPGEGILFIQNASALGPKPKTAEEITGEWSVIRRTGRAICALSLTNTQQGEEFTVRVAPGCDPVVVRFGPVTWQMDRGEIVLRAANGRTMRFEEGEASRWLQVPQSANPLLMVRK